MSGIGMALSTRGYVICPIKAVEVATLPPDQGQNLLTKALELPLPKNMTEAKGIFQSDIIIRTAINMAIADMRANPWLLEHVWASLIEDESTSQTYGEKERQKAKKWFLTTNIPVVMDYRLEEVEGTCISISLVDSVETENTLGDIHYQPTEDTEAEWPPLTSSFTPTKYHAATGMMEVPQDIADEVIISAGMIVLDSVGRSHEILDIQDSRTFFIKTGTVANFKGAVIKGQKPRLITQLESLNFKETYRIGAHAHGEPFLLTWLHSIVVFILLRYKQALLEARGFERSTMASAPFARNDALGRGENMWSRFVTLTGYVRQFWPKIQAERILSLGGQPKYSQINTLADSFVPDGDSEEDAAWLAQDGIGQKI